MGERVHADLGYTLCSYVGPHIPRDITPNQMTMFNHILNWYLLYLSWISVEPSLDVSGRRQLLLICSGINFVCMMLDCLDGMHARNTGQCSKVRRNLSLPTSACNTPLILVLFPVLQLGEILDHWMDAIHVPLVGGAILVAVQMDDNFFIAVFLLNCCLYNAQMILYNNPREFIEAAGAEAQISTSVVYAIGM